MSKPAIFLDRDGTIIEDTDYIRETEKVSLISGAVNGLQRLREKGYLLFVVSNQSGVGRGKIRDEEFLAVHQRVCELLQKAGVDIAEFAYCFHTPEEQCQCRKPRSGLVPRKYQGMALDLSKSFTVGDKESDLLLGDNLGAQAALVLTGKGRQTQAQLAAEGRAYPVYANLQEFAEKIPSVLAT
jgi:histidinol-phosphate phosphatase family protein